MNFKGERVYVVYNSRCQVKERLAWKSRDRNWKQLVTATVKSIKYFLSKIAKVQPNFLTGVCPTMSAFDDQNQAPDPRDQNKVNRYMSQYLNFDEEGLESEEYVSLVPENLIPFALETEVQDLTVIEEGEDTIRFHTEQIEYDEEYLVESMEEDYGCMHSEDEKDNDDEDTDEGTEYFAGTGELPTMGF
jgi:hypothetical protein